MKVRKVIWRFWFGTRAWSSPQRFGMHFVPDQTDGVMYAGVTLFGYSLLYSDVW